MDQPTDPVPPTPEALNLKQVARLLDVHYMTAYRYVRQGRLPARQVGTAWRVERRDVDALLAVPSPEPGSARAPADWVRRLADHLVLGDEIESWRVVGDALNAGHDVASIHLEVIAAAIGRVSSQVADGEHSAATERIAVATSSRLLARLGGQFPHRGRKRGTVVLAAPPGEHHGVPLLLVANLIRHAGYRVVELGTDTPAADVIDAVAALPTVVAVGLGVTTVDRLDAARELVGAVRAAHPSVPVLLGGQAVRNIDIAKLAGATAWSAGPDLIDQLHVLARRTGRPRGVRSQEREAVNR
ncbi:MAG TPA: helix-turn-helix domain-containing protein [Acidimicrobiales bacterium]|nr:helix-turn-helix domain-containing protein [Acidimicrobiales bacterium]